MFALLFHDIASQSVKIWLDNFPYHIVWVRRQNQGPLYFPKCVLYSAHSIPSHAPSLKTEPYHTLFSVRLNNNPVNRRGVFKFIFYQVYKY